MGAPAGPRVKQHNGGGVIEPDTQPYTGKLAFSVKRPLCMGHQLYIEYIKTKKREGHGRKMLIYPQRGCFHGSVL